MKNYRKVYVIDGGTQHLHQQKRIARSEGYSDVDIICYKTEIVEGTAHDIMINEYGYSGVCNLTEMYNISIRNIRQDIKDEIGKKFNLIIIK